MPTLAEFAENFLEQHSGTLKRGTLANYRSLLITHVGPRDVRRTLRAGCLGRLRLDQVTHQEIAALHRHLRGTPRAANHVLAFLSSLYSEAQAANLVPEGFNPTRRVKRYAVQSRQRFLTETDLARLGEVLIEAEADGSEDHYALAAIRLLIFTGCRRDEILDARWAWVDFERGLLNLPDSKTGAKPIFLSPAALEVLGNLVRIENNPFIIVGKRAGQRWVNLRKVWVRIRERAGSEASGRAEWPDSGGSNTRSSAFVCEPAGVARRIAAYDWKINGPRSAADDSTICPPRRRPIASAQRFCRGTSLKSPCEL